VTRPQTAVTEPGVAQRPARAIGQAAMLIGGITVLSNIVGFGRQIVFAHTVSANCLGTAYVTANQVPNIVYDVVIGGALTTALVPVLAAPAARRLAAGGPGQPGASAADAEASQIASALLSWTVLVLAPVSLLIAVLSGPLTSLLLADAPRCQHPAIFTVSGHMLIVFAPQILLYGLAVVLYGILQAHRRFVSPALAPVLSSLVVIATCVAFVPLSHGFRNHLDGIPTSALLVLSIGTTVGVAALALTALGPALRLGLRLRPTLHFPPGVASRIRSLAAVGVAALVAQDASVVAVIVLANSHQARGALVLYNFGWQMFFVPYAVLAVPLATTAYPVLSAAEGPSFDRTAAATTRAVMLVSWLGAALLAGAAIPAARLFTHHPHDSHLLALTLVAFAPGLVGYGLAACLSRVLFADGRARLAAVALVAGWLLVIVADVIAVALVPPRWVVPVLGLGNTAGLTACGLALLAVVRGMRGRSALRGTARAALAGLAGAVAGVAAGAAVSTGLPVHGFLPNAGIAILACGCVAVAFGAAVLVLDGGDLRAVLARIRERLPRARPAR
jgi:peptidoglycan biosynthesis protein MviN/MurJ (putative lipid II flippase)